MATKAAYKRLTKEYMAIKSNPVPYLIAKPLESNILEWHYVIRGPPNTPYHNGEYHGFLQFPVEYPFKPPSIRMITPSGRFHPNTRLCLSMSDFHPSSWNPSWSVATILNGLLSFMTGDEATTGSIKTSDTDKRIFASRSHQFNIKDSKFREIFPEFCVPELVPVEILYPLDISNKSGNSDNSNDSSNNNDNNRTGVNDGSLLLNEKFGASKNNQQIQKRQQINQIIGANSENNIKLSNDNKNNNRNGGNSINSSNANNNDTTNNTVVERSLFDKWRKWIIITLICLYLVLSKILARKSEAISSNDF